MNDEQLADYQAIADAAHELYMQISRQMSLLAPGNGPDWDDLYAISRLVHVAADLGDAAGKRAAERAADEPVPYLPTLAGFDAPHGHPAHGTPDGCTCGGIGRTGSHRPGCIWAPLEPADWTRDA